MVWLIQCVEVKMGDHVFHLGDKNHANELHIMFCIVEGVLFAYCNLRFVHSPHMSSLENLDVLYPVQPINTISSFQLLMQLHTPVCRKLVPTKDDLRSDVFT
jgi:hypothetical protein